MAIGMKNLEGDGINEINITPFVDIVLVLLIVFMISTPAMVYRGLQVSLPQAAKSEDVSHVTLNLTVMNNGQIYLDKSPLGKNGLVTAVQKLRNANVPIDALVSADTNVAHGVVMGLAGELQNLGITRVAFAVKGK